MEIFNALRTSTYAANIVPGLQFNSCWDSEGLDCALGQDEYNTPALDGAPWFSPARPGSANFLGFYPLSITGIEDSSRSMKVTELVEDGAVLSLPRRTSKEFRVRGLMMAADGRGLDAGMRWLRGALEAKDCFRCAQSGASDCAGHTSTYLAYLPTCCDYSDYSDRPVNWSNTAGETGQWAEYGEGVIGSQSDGVRVTMPCDGDGAQWFAEGLIPGATYRMTLVMRSPVEMRVSISGRQFKVARRQNVSGTLTQTPWVIDFEAEGSTEAIQVTQSSGGCLNAQATLQALRVQRIAERSKIFEPRFIAGDTEEPDSWNWDWGTTSPIPDNDIETAPSGQVERLRFNMENTGGSTMSIDSGTNVQRVVRGLRAGEKYTLYVNAVGDGVVPNPTPSMVGIPSTVSSLGNNWYSVAFTAQNAAHYISLGFPSGFTIPGLTEASFVLYYLRIDLNVSSQFIGPVDQSFRARRQLHGVELLSGPTVVQEYKTSAPAVMTEVEFTMVVARPFIYSELYTIPPAPSATTTLVPTGDCSTPAPTPIQDPDCPPIPVAPQPPGIEPDCVRDVDEWRRYWTEVPAELAGGWAESVPLITLTTGAEAVRDVRIRFYPNEMSAPIDTLDPCGFCGEFYISYVPADSEFTIDAIDRTAIASVNGAAPVRVMHLVSDENYGPVTWPEMSCDIPYYVTVDIAPDEVLDLNIDLSVALRE